MNTRFMHETLVSPSLIAFGNRAEIHLDQLVIPFHERTSLHPCQRLILETGPQKLEMRVSPLVGGNVA